MKTYYWALFFLCIVLYFPLFHYLGNPPISIWDEAIYANNAIEMAHSNDFLVLRNNNEPNLYNVKPPFVIWLQAIGIKIGGANEWAIRLPSAIAGLLTCFALFIFAHKTLNDYRIGIIGSLVLVSTQGLMRFHVARTGDLDAVLVFWITFYSLIAFHYCLKEPSNYKPYFNYIGIGVLLAFLTKSVAGFMPLLGILIGTILIEKAKNILTKSYTYKVAIAVFALCISYYWVRENAASGYWEKVYFSEYSRFTQNIMPFHDHEASYYLQNFVSLHFFTPYIYILPLCFILSLSFQLHRKVSILITAFCISYVGLISYPLVKLEWYDAPLYPMFALILGIAFVNVFKYAEPFFSSKFLINSLGIIAICLIFYKPYFKIIENLNRREPKDALEKEGFYIRELSVKRADLSNYKVLMTNKDIEHLDVANFYIKSQNWYQSKNIQLVRDTLQIRKGDTVLCCQEKNLNYLNSHFKTHVLDSLNGCKLLIVFRYEK
jgi:4-amino-4-deoxy-L-arabinose transferase-like glycosyltransferase